MKNETKMVKEKIVSIYEGLSLDLTLLTGYANIRFEYGDEDYNQDDPPSGPTVWIVGERPETSEEYAKRLEKERKDKEKKKIQRKAAKEAELQNTIDQLKYLEKQTSELKIKAEKLANKTKRKIAHKID